MKIWMGFLAAGMLAAQTPAPTFSKEVVRIFQRACQNCHHPGDIAPFSMMDYASVRPWARSIKDSVLLKTMPPWKPAQGAEVFRGARILSQQDINTISAWVDASAPEGDPADLPTPLVFDGSWELGAPDLVLAMTAPYSIPDSGADIYRCFSLPTNLSADTYVSALQVLPGNRAVVHHVIMYSDPSGISKSLEAGSTSGPGYPCFGDPGFTPDPSFLAAWAPGVAPSVMNPGTAMKIPKGGSVALQVHYHLNGTATSDQTQVGIYFSQSPVDKIVGSLPLVNTNFLIPAGNPHYGVSASVPIPGNYHLTSVGPHMHLLGREAHVSTVTPDGKTTTPLIDINDWDFNWQGFYDFVTPVKITPLTRVQFTNYYDNSANNGRNPNSPPKPVGWGEQTTDEMAVAFFSYTDDSQHLIAPAFTADKIANIGSWAGGTAAPGTILSLSGFGLASNWVANSNQGSLPTTLAGVKVTVDGVAAPLFYASPSQVNFQMPFETVNGSRKITLTREDGKSASVNLNVVDSSPGIFTQDGSGGGAALAAHLDGSLVTAANPAARGDYVILFATGLGRASPNVATGALAPNASNCVNPVTVTLGGRTLSPDYAGVAPGFAGFYQINLKIPQDLGTGNTQLKLTAAGNDSNLVTIAIN